MFTNTSRYHSLLQSGRPLAKLVLAVAVLAGMVSFMPAPPPRAQDIPHDRFISSLADAIDQTALTPREQLGLRLFFDANLSEPAGLACASCHDPGRAFTGNNGSKLGVAAGSRQGVFGTRDTPSAMYLASAPKFGFTQKDGKQVPAGGLFWDGRADTLEAQAKKANIPFAWKTAGSSPEEKAAHMTWLLEQLKELKADLVVLARYMQILSPAIVAAYPSLDRPGQAGLTYRPIRSAAAAGRGSRRRRRTRPACRPSRLQQGRDSSQNIRHQ